METFRVGGAGGSKKDTTNSGVRIVHLESGARGECRETRSQVQNKKMAFRRCIETPEFKAWMRIKTAEAHAVVDRVEDWVENQLKPENLKIELRSGGVWREWK